MSKSVLYYLALLLVSFLPVSCSQKPHDHDDEGHDHQAEISHSEEGEDDHHHEADEIILHRHEADEMGVATTVVEPSDFAEIITVGGEVLNAPGANGVVSAPTSGIVRLTSSANIGVKVTAGTPIASISARNLSGGDINEANRIALNAATAELDRVKTLFDERLATLQELNAAQAAYDAAKNAASGQSTGTATAPVAGVIVDVAVANGAFVNQGDPIAVISSTGALTVRADIPSRLASKAKYISGANIIFDNEVIKATKKGDATSSSNMPGYIPVFFTVEAGSVLQPGSLVEINIETTPRQGVITVPVSAVIERLGNRFVYQRLDEDCYRKLPVTTGSGNGKEIEIVSGLSGGEEIVTEGATVIRLAETSGAIPEGHSHHH